jgi:hypothetical protein
MFALVRLPRKAGLSEKNVAFETILPSEFIILINFDTVETQAYSNFQS